MRLFVRRCIQAVEMKRSADISECGRYRYNLKRWWDEGLGTVAFVGLNPSTADDAEDDPTIRRCIGFAQDWGFGGLVMLNLFAWRATNPREMIAACHSIGMPNNDVILREAKRCSQVICCWGVNGSYKNRAYCVVKMLADHGVDLHCLGMTRSGQPKHPLYLKKDTERVSMIGTCVKN